VRVSIVAAAILAFALVWLLSVVSIVVEDARSNRRLPLPPRLPSFHTTARAEGPAKKRTPR
jgi:hypothetical protein